MYKNMGLYSFDWNTFNYYININTIGIFILLIVLIYFIVTEKYYSKEKYSYKGIGDTGWDLPRKNQFWNYGLKRKKKKINKHEERCRQIFQSIYKCPFKSVRPDWLKNPITKKNLELDGFNPYIKTPIGTGLAFEYDGEQHSKYNKHFHKSPSDFVYQTKKDHFKDKCCREKGIFLVRIPYYVVYEDLERFIYNKLGENKLLPISS